MGHQEKLRALVNAIAEWQPNGNPELNRLADLAREINREWPPYPQLDRYRESGFLALASLWRSAPADDHGIYLQCASDLEALVTHYRGGR